MSLIHLAAVAETAQNDSWLKVLNYEILRGNPLWRLALVLLVVIVTLALGRILQYATTAYAARLKQRITGPLPLFTESLAKPLYVAVFAAGLYLCKAPLVFHDQTAISTDVGTAWTKLAQIVGAVALAYALYKLVDLVEYYFSRIVGKTDTRLDDMLVPILRKSLRVTILIIAVLLICEHLLGPEKVKSLLLSAGIGGIAVALAAKDTVANFFGSITIFADRPFHAKDLVQIGDHMGFIEEVGFRSTRIRTWYGHLVTIPNSIVANTTVENLGRRPFIRRISNITITYDSGAPKAALAVQIIKDILTEIPEVNTDPDLFPRVYFNEFNAASLNIYMSYWVKPPDYWLFFDVAHRVNLEMMRRFTKEKIEFAFPTQTLYLKKEPPPEQQPPPQFART